MIEILSTDVSDDTENNLEDTTIESKIISIISIIVQQCSTPIFQVCIDLFMQRSTEFTLFYADNSREDHRFSILCIFLSKSKKISDRTGSSTCEK
jgi:hypothetical protein